MLFLLMLFKAAWYPESPSKEDERMMTQFMNAFARFYPCVSTLHWICINNEALKCRLFCLEIHHYFYIAMVDIIGIWHTKISSLQFLYTYCCTHCVGYIFTLLSFFAFNQRAIYRHIVPRTFRTIWQRVQ